MPEKMSLTEMASVRQAFSQSCIKDLFKKIASEVSTLPIHAKLNRGDSVAVAVGSRGITRLNEVVRHCIRILKDMGLNPFIVPAMGSHGGATAKGQKILLEKFGVTEQAMGVPIESDMTVVCPNRLSIGKKCC